MSLDLDDRQRAMLQEMGLRVWAPERPIPKRPEPGEQPVSVRTPALPAAVEVAVRPVVKPDPATLAPPLSSPAPQTRPAAVPSVDSPPDALAPAIAACQACRLCQGRRAPVFDAAGSQQRADWLVVGDPPEEVDEQGGTPFAGPPGLLLDNMLRALGLQRQQGAESGADPAARAYLSHVVKCRSPVGGPPEAAELAACHEFLQREIAQVRPRVILALGRLAAISLLQGSVAEVASIPLGQLRGRVHQVQGLPLVVSYSPSYLMRNQADKARAWADLCLARSALHTIRP